MTFRFVALALALLAAAWAAHAIHRWIGNDSSRHSGPGGVRPALLRNLRVGLYCMPALTGALSVLVPAGNWVALTDLVLICITLYALALADAMTLSVDTRLVAGALSVRMLALALMQPLLLPSMILGLLSGAGLLVVIGVFYRALRRREGLGEGDAAVMGLIGAFVGWRGIFPALAVAAFCGLLVALPALLIYRKPINTAIPFVPFLALGGLVVYVLQELLGWDWPLRLSEGGGLPGLAGPIFP